MSTFEVHRIPACVDNDVSLPRESTTGMARAVDPSDAAPVLEGAAEQMWNSLSKFKAAPGRPAAGPTRHHGRQR